MSENTTSQQRTSDSYTEQVPVQPWSAETYANKLMDELFSDIDRVLEGGGKLPTEPVKSEYVSLQPVKITQITAPPAVIPPADLIPKPEDPLKIVEVKKPDIKPVADDRDRNQLFDKILFGATLTTLILTLILWLVSRQGKAWVATLNSPTSAPAVTKLPSASDVQFINYMLRSLEVLDRKAQLSKQQTALGNPPASTTVPLPQQSAPQIPTQISPNRRQVQIPYQAPTIQERIYIPIYPSPQPAPAPANVGVKPRAVLTPAPSARVPAPSARVPAPTVAKPKPSVAVKPSLVPQPPVPLPPARTVPTLTPSLMPSLLPSSIPSVKHTLVGLLELGDRSAALFDIGGVTQRIHVGEGIGSSGWSLVAVANQEAIIRRNGEIRSIYVGQKF